MIKARQGRAGTMVLWADKLGLLVWQDMPSRRAQASDERVQRARTASDDNSAPQPSVDYFWVVFNEGWGQYDTVRVTQMAMAQIRRGW